MTPDSNLAQALTEIRRRHSLAALCAIGATRLIAGKDAALKVAHKLDRTQDDR